ncbi:S-type anion channel [Seminavis robusta]|uniref:S-type anion channel n=1 Tax=Seminavis robusta TaxID=568900 RepID=A0A9N8DVD8_9STRA|nr:S-type anion channel [Seminavis robusta]|eukprot:Sro400_g135030.1 S-type anion channel (193) ;mRNA; r:14351-14929
MSYRNRQRSDGSQKQLISDGGYSTFDSGSYQRDDLLGAPKQSSTDDNTMSSEEQAPPPQPQATFQEYPRHVIMRIPNTAFGISMGLAGNAILWKSVGKSAIFNAANANTEALHGILWLLALLVAAWVFTCYCYKCYYHYELVVREWQHPVRVHFMNAPHLIMLMLAIGLPDRFNASEMALQIVFGLGLVFRH